MKHRTQSNFNLILLIVLAVAITAMVLGMVVHCEFVTWDDGQYVLSNSLIKNWTWQGVKNVFSTPQVVGTYSPIVLLSWMVDYGIDGLNPTIFHAFNLLFHCLNVGLVFLLIFGWTKNRAVAFLVSILFGIHPMNVEVVAWVTGRKDLIYALFFLAALVSYHRYMGRNDTKWFIITFCFFTLSTLSKAVAVVFPLVLLLADNYVYEKRLDAQSILQKLPFFLVSVGVGIWAYMGQSSSGAISSMDNSLLVTPFIATYGYLVYLIKLILPLDLSAFHPYPYELGGSVPWYIFASVIPFLILSILFVLCTQKQPLLRFGGLFFLLMLLPTSQLLPIGSAVIAERYVYLGYIGLFLMMAVFLTHSILKYPGKTAVLKKVAVGLFLIFLGYRSYHQTKVWKNSGTLWSQVKEAYPRHYLAYEKLGLYAASIGEVKQAINLFSSEIELAPNNADAYCNRAMAYMSIGKIELALADNKTALILDPLHPTARMNMGVLFMNLGQFEKALPELEAALKRDTVNPKLFFNLGKVNEHLGQSVLALRFYSRAIELDTAEVEFYYHRARFFAIDSHLESAMKDIDTGLKLNPNHVNLLILSSEVKYSQLNYTGALADINEAIRNGAGRNDAYIEQLERLVGSEPK